ncbi:E3 ubiquitin-protein ligase RLIM-like isoform X1 [Vanessa atalanta]|uniref:E3 ubiquitin-protein ligase RLIM-like isoform X1 n=1 Tax=Vanessa atalanta TaxID=42275 RepID=UPI001FCDEE27|nr:E3 ubiquitin-protein ligase RLIM-like isoform X1 [Vanessa atalanta]
MSFREEDKEKEKGGLGTGFAVAAAIGVGVGAALYYFINKRTENPTAAGSTAQGWTCDSPHTLHVREEPIYISDDSYTTLSEHSTTDTSILDDSFTCKCVNNDSENETFESNDSSFSESQSSYSQSNTDTSRSMSDDDDSDESDMFNTITSSNELNDSELSEWDVTTSLDYPSYEQPLSRSYIENFTRNLLMSQQRDQRNNQFNSCDNEAFRERSWSIEECSICCDVVLRDQEIMSLPCTHNFHTKCILPWLQEHQTCPNCRKPID